jgi:F-type H+-transporting ATPase subunit delta
MTEVQHRTVLDTGLQYLGTVYAKALIGAMEKVGKTEEVLEELGAFIAEGLDPFPRFDATMCSPRGPQESKERALERAFRGKLSPQLLDFLKVLARRGRFDAIRAVHQAARKILNDLRGRVEVHLTTAEPIDSATREMILGKLRSSLKTEIDLKTHLDPKLLGGLLIRVGDTVYDGSLANQLARLRNELVATATQRMRVEAERFSVAN